MKEYFIHSKILKKLAEMDRWSKDVAEGCRHAQENVPSIPPLLPTCKITKRTCAFDDCPLGKVNRK